MRIISQDGTDDVPYERSNFFMQPRNDYIEILCCVDEHSFNIAEYSTSEKALKAMKMLHDKYLSIMELKGGYGVVTSCYVQPNFWVLPKVFQFPQDSEVDA